MTPYQSYQLFQAGRQMSAAEQRRADARTGELAAAISRPVIAVSARIQAALRRQNAGFAARHADVRFSGSDRPLAVEESAAAIGAERPLEAAGAGSR